MSESAPPAAMDKGAAAKTSASNRISASELQEIANSRLHPEHWDMVPGQLAWNNRLEIGEDEKI